MAKNLDRYKEKRRFDKTPEPTGGRSAVHDPIFVIQKHHARRMHYDLRLQIGNSLRSWAVPEGPCLDPNVRRFAKLVEDHPLDYATFEGRIPDGNYGAGTVIVWDRGTWVTLADDANKALEDGELKFRLAGQKLSGGWTLVRLADEPTNFLLIKERDVAARPLADYDVLKEQPNSVITGRPVDDVPSIRKRDRPLTAQKVSGGVVRAMPTRWSPQLPTLSQTVPKIGRWVHEIKYDGYRTLVFFDHGKVRLFTRNGHDWTKRYSALAKAFEKLPCDSAIVDGEIVVQDPRGVSSLNLLEAALSSGSSHELTYFAFDLCYLNGRDLSGAGLLDRKRALEGLIDPLIDQRSHIQLSEHVEGDGNAFYEQACRLGLEGIVSKRADSRYVQRRSTDWLKVKRREIGTFVVVGYIAGAPKCVTSLLLAEERDGQLVYAGRVGSGISDSTGRELHSLLAGAERQSSVVRTPRTTDAHWIEPNWSAEITYATRSAQDAPRQPVFLRILKRAKLTKALKPKLVGDRELAAIHLTNPEREMFSGSGVTKLDIALYYARVGDWLLPELLRRPVSIIRCSTGGMKDCFYQRHAFAGLPDGVETINLSDEEGRAAFITITEPKGYLALTQFGAVEFHPWCCHVDDPEHPDRLIIDLDPDTGLSWTRVCDAAEILRTRLDGLGFRPFLRTTGGKGLHIVISLTRTHTWPVVKGFAQSIARAMASDMPKLFTAVSAKEQRKDRIYIDYLRNGRGASAVASYSLRARAGFPVATPITWQELRLTPGGDFYNRLNLLPRLQSLAADPWDGLVSSAVEITQKMRRDVGMKQ